MRSILEVRRSSENLPRVTPKKYPFFRSLSENPSYFTRILSDKMRRDSTKLGTENLLEKNGKLPNMLTPNRKKISISEPNTDSDRPPLRRARGNSIVNALQFGSRSSKKFRSRLVQKNGYCNISLVNVPKQGLKYCSDIFTTLIEFQWRWILFTYCSIFIMSWFLFSGLYYLIVFAHNDLDPVNIANTSFTPCIGNIKSYTSVFIFTFASQTTIGYGYRFPTEECIHLLLVMCVQNLCGVMLQTLMAGVVFAKLARPKKRAETILFSKHACICMRDGQLCFLFRVGDMRKTQLAEAHVRLQMIKKRITDEGELIPFHQYDMNVGFDTGLDRIFLVWPITVCHVIDEDSPLYDISEADMKHGGTARFEILVLLEGVVESTGATTQARTGYVTEEVQWGHRFEKMATYRNQNGTYRIDFARFHKTYKTEIPPFSAKQLDLMEKKEGSRPLVQYQRSVLDEVKDDKSVPDKHNLAYRVKHKLSSVLERPRLEDIYAYSTSNSEEHEEKQRTIEEGLVDNSADNSADDELEDEDQFPGTSPETDMTPDGQDRDGVKTGKPEAVRKRISWKQKRKSDASDIVDDDESSVYNEDGNMQTQPPQQLQNLPPPQKKMSKFRGHDIM